MPSSITNKLITLQKKKDLLFAFWLMRVTTEATIAQAK